MYSGCRHHPGTKGKHWKVEWIFKGNIETLGNYRRSVPNRGTEGFGMRKVNFYSTVPSYSKWKRDNIVKVVTETEVDKIGCLSTLSVQGVSFERRSTLINMPMDQIKFLIKSVYDLGTSEQKQIIQKKEISLVYYKIKSAVLSRLSTQIIEALKKRNRIS